MFRNNVYTFKTLPIEEKQRQWTDCCCTIVTALFALTLFVLSFVFFQKDVFYKVNFPADDTGSTCSFDQPTAPLMYFTDPIDLSSGRHCLKSCPLAGHLLDCPNAGCSTLVSTYNTVQQINRLGAFCVPTDSSLQSKFWSNPLIANKNLLVNSYDIILLSLLIGIGVGTLYLAFMSCIPKSLTKGVFILTFLALVAAGVMILVLPVQIFSNNLYNIIFASLLLVAGLLFLIYFFCYRREIEVASIFLQHANNCLKDTPAIYGYLPLFLLFCFGLLVLCCWQYIAFGTMNGTELRPGDLYYTSKQSLPLEILNFIELIWGLQFLKDAMNFVVSGNAVEWYFKANSHSSTLCCRPFSRLLKRNWGSVAGGSFLNAFFNWLNIFFDLFRCDPAGSCGKCYQNTCCCFDYLFELIRSDAYAFINLAGVPYCNAARQCEALCQNSRLFHSRQSCVRLYQFAAHMFLIVVMALVAWAILMVKIKETTWIILGLIVLASYMSVNFFISLHSDAAEGIMVCYLTEENCEGEDMKTCPLELRNDIYQFELHDSSAK